VIDPGPEDEGHIEAVRAAAKQRGGIGDVLLTHSHGDHSHGVELLGVDPTAVADGDSAGGISAVATPGHASDHLCFLIPPDHPVSGGVTGSICFSGDLILGEGSTIVPAAAQDGSLAAYMESLRKLSTLDLELIYPGHGPVVRDPAAKIAEYIAHRMEREAKLVEALDAGERSRLALLDAAWDDVSAELRPMAAFAMEAHLEKLAGEGKLPDDLAE
jgi:glyoxylase-like metal-dependent hydrolase (beta-lactamase superfamily II)